MPLSVAELIVSFPGRSITGLDQDEEWFALGRGDDVRRIRFHDYGEIYAVQGLYEHLFYERLQCQSPTVVTALLEEHVRGVGENPADFRVLDLGAGNGMVGEALRERGFGEVVGVDIEPESGPATERDRPGVYSEFHVCDLLDPDEDVRAALEAEPFTAMTSVAALGFGDVPPAVFERAYGLVASGGCVAFTIKEDFLADDDDTGFSALIARMLADGRMQERARRRYRHRLDVHGRPLHYIAMVGVKP